MADTEKDRQLDSDEAQTAEAGSRPGPTPTVATSEEPAGKPEPGSAEPSAPDVPSEASGDQPAGRPDERVDEPADVQATAAGEPAAEEPPTADQAPEQEAAAEDDRKQWYIIHTYSGFENKVAQSLRQRADAYGMGDKIGEILVPTEDVAEIRDGKKVVTKKKFFPGYVLVHMEMSDEAWHAVRSTPKCTGFVGGGQRPMPMTQEEVDRIIKQVHVTKEKPKPKFDYRVGETVKIMEGPFSNFTGVVEEVNEDRATLKVMVSIFGRATPVELEFHQVKRPE
ncbi:MAG: transcription termination/antitermination protein NusG [Acidobacteriota bacterium]|nr:MAG: transcription termination/antitermination protein NusG [Acidobacteriota bacterium]